MIFWKVNCQVCGDYIMDDILVLQLYNNEVFYKYTDGHSIKIDLDFSSKYKWSATIRKINLKYNEVVYIVNKDKYYKDKIPAGPLHIIHINNLDFLYPIKSNDIVYNIMDNINMRSQKPLERAFYNPEDYPLFYATNKHDAIQTLEVLEKEGFVRLNNKASEGRFLVQQTIEGMKYLEDNKNRHDTGKVFVAMSFHIDERYIYDNILKPAIKKADKNLIPIRIDDPEISDSHEGAIDDLIIDQLNNCDLVIADLTKNKGGVYFEAGYAEGQGVPVIYTVDKITNEIHFDTEHRVITEIGEKDASTKKRDEIIDKLANKIRVRLYSRN